MLLFSQAHWKGYKQKKNFNDRKQYLKDHDAEAVKVKLLCTYHHSFFGLDHH